MWCYLLPPFFTPKPHIHTYMQHKFVDDTEDGLPDNQVELAERCAELWDKCFALGYAHPDWNANATKYNIAANAYNRNAGAAMMTALTKDTANPNTGEDYVAASALAAYVPSAPVAAAVSTAKQEKQQKTAPVKLFGASYTTTDAPMPLTPEIEAILKQDVAGAVKIREVYLLNPEGFNMTDFEKYSGINKGRIVGCLKKMHAKDE